MRKVLLGSIILIVYIITSAFTAHRFYVSIYQIDYKPAKKELQITSRIFLDDLIDAIEVSSKKRISLGEKSQTSADLVLFERYQKEHLLIRINNKEVTYKYLSSELENNVFISYFKVENLSSVKSIEVKNTALFEILPTQQNIIQITNDKAKASLLLTTENRSGKQTF